MNFKMDTSKEPTFEQKGLKGYRFPLENKELEIYYCDVSQGHDNYIISKKCYHLYYILEGNGTFEIEGVVQDITKGSFIEVPPHKEYTYSGKMKLLLIMNPPWFEANEKVTRSNPKVH